MVPMGIGTGATRAGIIGELYKKGFLENFTKDITQIIATGEI